MYNQVVAHSVQDAAFLATGRAPVDRNVPGYVVRHARDGGVFHKDGGSNSKAATHRRST